MREPVAAPRVVETPRAPASEQAAPAMAAPPPPTVAAPPIYADNRRSENFYEIKSQIFGALIEAIDLTQLAKLDAMSAREEIRDIVSEIISIKNVVMSIAEQEELL